MSEFLKDRKNREKTLSFLREVERFHLEAEKDKVRLLNPPFRVLPKAREAFEEMKASCENLWRMSDVNNAEASLEKLTEAYEKYIFDLKQFYSIQVSFSRLDNEANNEAIDGLIKLAEESAKNISEKFRYVSLASGGLDEVLTAGENEDKARTTFPAIKTEIGNTVTELNLNPEAAKLHGQNYLPDNMNWLNGLTYNGYVPADKKEEFMRETGMDFPDLSIQTARNGALLRTLPVDETVNSQPADYIAELGFKNRDNTHSALFACWAIARKGMSIDQAADLSKMDEDEAKKLLNEFYEYQKKYPFIQRHDTKENAERRVKEWVRNFKKVKDAIANYKLPDIDYSDPEQIRPYQAKFDFLQSLAVNAVQEYEAVMNSPQNNRNINTFRVAGDELGGEEEAYKLQRFFFHFQGLISLAYKIPHGYEMEMADNRRMFTAYHKAYGRFLAGKIMPLGSGKTIGEFIDENKGVFDRLEPRTINKGKEYFSMRPDEVSPKTVASYLMNYGKAEFESKAEEIYRGIENTKTLMLPEMLLRSATTFRFTPMQKELRSKLANLPDDPWTMRDFLSRKADGELDGRDYVSKAFSEIFMKNFHACVYDIGKKDTDFFLIDGRTPAEIWRDKYQNVADEKELENLYRLEVLKTIAKGEKRISFRPLKLDENDKYRFGDAVVLYEPRKTTEKLVGTYKNYIGEQRNLLGELLVMKNTLLESQRNKEANFDGQQTEGGTAYQNFTARLRDLIDTLDNVEYGIGRDVKIRDIRRKVSALQEEAARFYSAKKGFIFGPSDVRDKAGLKVAGQIMNNNYLNRFDSWTRDLVNSELLIIEPNVTPSNATNSELLQGMGILQHSLDGTNFARKNIEEEFVRNRLSVKLAAIHADKNYLAIKNGEKGESKKLAQIYLDAYFENKLSGTAVNGQNREERLTVKLLRDIDKYSEKLEALQKNPAFIRLMKNDPEGCIKNWGAISVAAEDSRLMYYNRRMGFRQNNSYTRYVAGLGQNDEPGMTMENKINLQLARPDWNRQQKDDYINTCYIRLTDVVISQILSGYGPKNSALRERISENPETVLAMRDIIQNYFREKGSLNRRNLARTAVRLDNTEFRDTLCNKLTEEFSRRDKESENTKKLTETQNVTRLNFVNNGNVILTEQMWNDYNAKTDLTICNEAYQNSISAENQMLGRVGSFAYRNPDEPDAQPVNIRPSSVDFANAGLDVNNPGSVQNMFILWLMAEKGLSFDKAVKKADTEENYRIVHGVEQVINQRDVEEAYQLRGEFYQFVRANTITPESSVQEFENAQKAWAGILTKGTEKMKEFKIPNINFRDKEQIEVYQSLLMHASGMGDDVLKNFGNIFRKEGPASGIRIVKKEMTEGRFHDTQDFWKGMKNGMSAFKEGFGKPVNKTEFIGRSVSELNKYTIQTAVMRKLAVDELQRARNITFDNLAKQQIRSNRHLYEEKAVSAIKNAAANGSLSGVTPMLVTQYLMSHESPVFEKTVAGIKKQYDKRENTAFYSNQLREVKSWIEYISENLGPVRDAFKALPDDDFYSVEQFMEADVGGNGKMKDWAEKMYDKLLSGNFGDVLSKNGRYITDAVKLDGIPVSEVFRGKYDDLITRDQREQFYRMELLKAIATGSSQISVDISGLKNDRIVDVTDVKVLPSNAEAVHISEGVRAYAECIEDIIAEMEAFREKLQLTQQNRNNNFVGTATEGPKEYKFLTKNLRDCLDVLYRERNGQATPDEVLSSLQNVNHAANVFFEESRGFLGGVPNSEPGKTRFNIACDLEARSQKLLYHFNNARRDFASDIVTENGETIRMAGYGAAKREAEKLEALYQIDLMSREDYKKLFLGHEITRCVDALRELLMHTENAEMAKIYVCEYYRNKVLANQQTTEDLKVMTNPLPKINELAANPIFVEKMRVRPMQTIDQWNDIERRERMLRRRLGSQNADIKSFYGSESAFLLDMNPLGPRQRAYTANQLAQQFNSLSNEQRNDLFSRLTGIVYRQMLTKNSQSAARLRYLVASDDNFGESMKSFINEKLKDLRPFGNPNQNLFSNPQRISEVLSQVDNGEMAQSVWPQVVNNLQLINYNALRYGAGQDNLNQTDNQIENRTDNQIDNQIDNNTENIIPENNNNADDLQVNLINNEKPVQDNYVIERENLMTVAEARELEKKNNNIGNNIENIIDNKIDNNIENIIDNKIDNNIENNIENKIENSIENNINVPPARKGNLLDNNISAIDINSNSLDDADNIIFNDNKNRIKNSIDDDIKNDISNDSGNNIINDNIINNNNIDNNNIFNNFRRTRKTIGDRSSRVIEFKDDSLDYGFKEDRKNPNENKINIIPEENESDNNIILNDNEKNNNIIFDKKDENQIINKNDSEEYNMDLSDFFFRDSIVKNNILKPKYVDNNSEGSNEEISFGDGKIIKESRPFKAAPGKNVQDDLDDFLNQDNVDYDKELLDNYKPDFMENVKSKDLQELNNQEYQLIKEHEQNKKEAQRAKNTLDKIDKIFDPQKNKFMAQEKMINFIHYQSYEAINRKNKLVTNKRMKAQEKLWMERPDLHAVLEDLIKFYSGKELIEMVKKGTLADRMAGSREKLEYMGIIKPKEEKYTEEKQIEPDIVPKKKLIDGVEVKFSSKDEESSILSSDDSESEKSLSEKPKKGGMKPGH